jgi:acyl dehydratase
MHNRLDQRMPTNSYTNRTFDEIEIGATVTMTHRLSRTDVEALAFVSGDVDPFHVEAGGARDEGMVADAVAAEAIVSGLLQRRLPGPGTTIIAQQLRFQGVLAAGDELEGIITARRSADGHEIDRVACARRRGSSPAP